MAVTISMLLSLSIGVAPALAEGASTWRGFWGILPDFNTTRYHDNNLDSAPTQLGLRYCHQSSGQSADGMKWTLVRYRALLPDPHVATNTIGCLNNSTGRQTSYGRQGESEYYFKYRGMTSGTSSYIDGEVKWFW